MLNCSLIRLKVICSEQGSLTPIEGTRDIPFEIKRVYYIYGVPDDAVRGFHAHRRLHQVLICLHGSFKVECEFGDEREVYELNSPEYGLYVGPYVWRVMFDFKDDPIVLVLASDYYDESDYIRDYNLFREEVKKLFG